MKSIDYSNNVVRRVCDALHMVIPNLDEFFPKGELSDLIRNNVERFAMDMPLAEVEDTFETIIWDIPIRRCSVCGCLMQEGYYLDGEYACNESCRNKFFIGNSDMTEAEADIFYLNESEDDYYWTEWD